LPAAALAHTRATRRARRRASRARSARAQLGLPNIPKPLREVQLKLEEGRENVDRVLFSKADAAVGQARSVAKGQAKDILKAVPAGQAAQGEALLADIQAGIDAFAAQLGRTSVEGSQREAAGVLAKISALEELIATAYVQPAVPAEFAGLPRLKGRASIEFELKRPGDKFDVEGTLYDKLTMTTIVDG
jgi:hypothetical protein